LDIVADSTTPLAIVTATLVVDKCLLVATKTHLVCYVPEQVPAKVPPFKVSLSDFCRTKKLLNPI
jgi:hypothetical protein